MIDNATHESDAKPGTSLEKHVRRTGSIATLNRRGVRRLERTMRQGKPAVRRSPLRVLVTSVAVVGMLAGLAVPAYAAIQPTLAEVTSLQSIAEQNAQSISVDAAAKAAPLTATVYGATTPDEIEQARAEKAAAEAAALARQQAAAAASSAGATQAAAASAAALAAVPAVPAASGFVNPLGFGNYTLGQGIAAGAYRNHQGQDMLAAAWTPIRAVADGVVTVSGWTGGYGNGVYIEHNVGGVAIQTRYGHMIQAPDVSVGQTVTAGQVIGYVGSTGNSTANHLHIEVRVNGVLVEPVGYLGL